MTRATLVDREVGARVRIRRQELGITQQELGRAIGVTFQQIQKYEIGHNRIGAGRLYAISRHLRVPITYFFDKMLDSQGGEQVIDAVSTAELLQTSGALDLLRHYARIEKPQLRRIIQQMARTLAS